MGAYHTLDLEMNRKFTLGKHEWDSIALERIGIQHTCTQFLIKFFLLWKSVNNI